MARPRSKGNKDLPQGLYEPSSPGRCYRIRHPLTGKFKSLETRDEKTARKLHTMIYPRLMEEKLRVEADTLQKKIEALTGAKTATLGQFASDMLRVVDKLTNRKGKQLSTSVRQAIRLVLKHLSEDPEFGAKPLAVFADIDEGPRLVRTYLASSIDQPSWYNMRLGALSRLFKRSIEKGMLSRNPCDPVTRLHTPERDVYIPDDAYLAIHEQLVTRWHEVYARCCDLIYLMSARVSDALDLEESQIHDDRGVILFQASKNGVWIEMVMNDDLRNTIDWFRTYKRREGIVNTLLCVHPILRTQPGTLAIEQANSMTDTAIAAVLGISNTAFAKRVKRYGLDEALKMGKGRYACTRELAGKAITVGQLRDRVNDARTAAHIEETFTLRDLRPKGLTDEAMIAGGATNKGGWKGGSDMPQRYVKLPVPVRTRNNLRVLKR